MRSKVRLFGAALAFIGALSLYGQAAPSAPMLLEEARSRLDRAVSAFDTEGILEAADLFRQTLAINPRYAEAEVGLAEALIWLNDYAGAVASLDRAEALRYPGTDADLLRARLAILSGDLQTAARIYDEILEAEPFNGEVLVADAVLSLAGGTGPVAYRRLQALEERYPRNLQLLVALIELSMRDGNDTATRRYVDLALRYHNDNAVVQSVAARVALNDGDATGAAAYARNAVGIAPEYDAAWLLMAQAAEQLGRTDEARTHYEALIALDPDNHRAWYARSILLARLGSVEEAAVGLRRALDIRPDYEIARIALEHIVSDSTDLDDSRRQGLAAHYLQAGKSLEDRFLHRSAERVYRRGLQIYPFDADLRIALAELYLYRNFRARYLQELEVLDSIGYEGYDLDDRIEAYRSLLRDSLSRQWGIDQFTASRPRTSIVIVSRQDGTTLEPDASQHIARYLASLVNTSQNATVLETTAHPGDRTRAIARARGIDADLVVFLDSSLEDRRIVLDVEIVDTLSAATLVRRVIPRTAAGRLDQAVQDAGVLVMSYIPVRGTVLVRRDDRVLVSIGSVDGIAPEDRVELRTARSGRVLGEAPVVRTDDLLAEIAYTPDGPDLLGRGDEALYLGPPPDEEEEVQTSLESTPPVPRNTTNLPLIRSLFSVPD